MNTSKKLKDSYGYLFVVIATLLPGPIALLVWYFRLIVLDVVWLVPIVVAFCVTLIGGRKRFSIAAGLVSVGTIYLFDIFYILGGMDCIDLTKWSWLQSGDCATNPSGAFVGLLVSNVALLSGFIAKAKLTTNKKGT